MPTAYPWGALEPVSLAAERAASAARRELRVLSPVLSAELSQLLELPSEVLVKRARLGRVPALSQTLWLARDRVALGMLAEPALAAFLAARVLRRSEPLAHPQEPLSPELEALLAALAVEVARRQGLSLMLLGAPPVGEEALLVEVTLLLEGRPFSLTLYVVGAFGGSLEPPRLEQLGQLELRIPLVLGSFALERQELLSLQLGAALLPPPELRLDPQAGHAVLAAPQSERGIEVQLRPDGRLVVGVPTQARLSVEREKTSEQDETLTDVLLDTPVVVRVELGAVSMTAREWAQLGPGDIVETEQRIAEPVVLRVAGREVGRGELVNVDGQIGVRIQKLFEAPV